MHSLLLYIANVNILAAHVVLTVTFDYTST